MGLSKKEEASGVPDILSSAFQYIYTSILFTNETSKAGIFESKWYNREKAQTTDSINRKKNNLLSYLGP